MSYDLDKLEALEKAYHTARPEKRLDALLDFERDVKDAAPAMIRDLRDVPRLQAEHAAMREALEGLLWRIKTLHVDMGGKHKYTILNGAETVRVVELARRALAGIKGEKP